LIYKEYKHGFNSWKWSNLTWDSSSSAPIYFSVLPLSGRQMPLHEKHSDIGKMTECYWQYVSLENFNFLLGTSVA